MCGILHTQCWGDSGNRGRLGVKAEPLRARGSRSNTSAGRAGEVLPGELLLCRGLPRGTRPAAHKALRVSM